jgi:hypothetical protein
MAIRVKVNRASAALHDLIGEVGIDFENYVGAKVNPPKLLEINSGVFFNWEEHLSKPKLILFLSTCSACGDEQMISELQALSQDLNFHLIGIGSANSSRELKKFAYSRTFSFPILYDEDNFFRESIGLPNNFLSNYILLLQDRSNEILLVADGSRNISERLHHAIKKYTTHEKNQKKRSKTALLLVGLMILFCFSFLDDLNTPNEAFAQWPIPRGCLSLCVVYGKTVQWICGFDTVSGCIGCYLPQPCN